MTSFAPRFAAPWIAARPIELRALTSLPSSCASLHRFEQRRGPFVESLGDGPVHAGRDHQRRRAGVGRDVRIRAVRKQQTHHAQVAGGGRTQERRLAREIDPRHGADDDDDIAALVRELPRACVRLCSCLEQALDQRERFVADAGRLVRGAELEIAQVDGSPERRLAIPIHRVDVGAGVEQQIRYT